MGRDNSEGGGQAMNRRVLVVDDHALVAMGLQLALTTREWDVETCNGPLPQDVIDHTQRFAPACVLIDIFLGESLGSGIELIGPLTKAGAQVVVLTNERRRVPLAECLEAGAAGWVRKRASLDEVDTALGHVVSGGSVLGRSERAALLDYLRQERRDALRRDDTVIRSLTQREAVVLGALLEGLSAEEIAEANYVALSTVRSQIRAVLQKLGVRSQLAAVAMAAAHRDLLPTRVGAVRDRRRTATAPRSAEAGALYQR